MNGATCMAAIIGAEREWFQVSTDSRVGSPDGSVSLRPSEQGRKKKGAGPKRTRPAGGCDRNKEGRPDRKAT